MRLGEIVARGFRRLFPPRTLGQRSEWAAAKYLKRKGYKILALGDRLKHRDELDIVAADGRTVVFVEVKTRASQLQGHPAEAVDAAKQRRLTKLAVLFLKRHGLLDSHGPRTCASRRSSTSKTPSKRWGSGSFIRE